MSTIPWRTGVNMREFAYYNTTIVPNTVGNPQLQRQQLTKLQQMNVKLVRFYASANTLTTPQCISQVRQALDLLAEFNMQAIVCLDDSLGSGLSVPGMTGFATANGHYVKSFWVDKVYEQLYLPHIKALVGQFATHPAVMIWELGNEYALHPTNPLPTQADIDAFFKFAKVASKAIKNLSPKLVSTGLANSRQISFALGSVDAFRDFAKRLYSIPTIDVVCIHYYKDEGEKENGQIDTGVAKHDVRKPYYIGELGARFVVGNDRSPFYQQEMQGWRDDGAFSVLAWQFDNSPFDVGIGDDKAMARRVGNTDFTDFNALCNVVQSFGADVSPFATAAISAVPAPVPMASLSANGKRFTLLPAKSIHIRRDPEIQDGNSLGKVNGDTPLEAVNPALAMTKVGQENEWIRVRLEGWVAADSLNRVVEAAAPIPAVPSLLNAESVPDLSDLPNGQQRAWDFDHEPQFVCAPVKDPTLIRRFSGFGPNNFSYMSYRDDLLKGIGAGGYYKNLGGLHNGLDIVIPSGSMLCSVDWGVVVHVSTKVKNNPFGASPFSVIIRYGNHLALYGHMLSVEGMKVQAGQIVGPGTEIGLSGVGNDLAHLHFELRNISAAHINKLRQAAEAISPVDVPLQMSNAFNLNNWWNFVPDYVNPIGFFTPPLPVGNWLLAASLPDVDTDHNGYPDQVIHAGQNAPEAYDLESIPSYPRGIQTHFWQGSREV